MLYYYLLRLSQSGMLKSINELLQCTERLFGLKKRAITSQGSVLIYKEKDALTVARSLGVLQGVLTAALSLQLLRHAAWCVWGPTNIREPVCLGDAFSVGSPEPEAAHHVDEHKHGIAQVYKVDSPNGQQAQQLPIHIPSQRLHKHILQPAVSASVIDGASVLFPSLLYTRICSE